MSVISSEIASEFCSICNWTYETWVIHKSLFDDNKHIESTIGNFKHFTSRLSIITQEYSLLQIAKLHDPARQGKSINITIEYMTDFADWGTEKQHVRQLGNKLSKLFTYIKGARNKSLAHNDLEAFCSGNNLGAFPDGLDIEYFDVLQLFASTVWNKWFASKAYTFDTVAKRDISLFLEAINNHCMLGTKR